MNGHQVIKSLRADLGISQAKLAAHLGCTQGSVGHYEVGRQVIPPERAAALIVFAAQHGKPVTWDDVYRNLLDTDSLVKSSGMSA